MVRPTFKNAAVPKLFIMNLIQSNCVLTKNAFSIAESRRIMIDCNWSRFKTSVVVFYSFVLL